MSANKPYEIPDPRKRPDSFLTVLYKTLKCIEFDDRAWDKEFFARCNKRTGYMLEIFDGDVQMAAKCMQALKDQFEGDGISWTIETMCQYAFQWKAEQLHKTDKDTTRRFLHELMQQNKIEGLQKVDVGPILQRLKEASNGNGVPHTNGSTHALPDVRPQTRTRPYPVQ